MKSTVKDTLEAQNKFWAAQDAQLRNTVNKSLWDRDVQLKIDRMKVALGDLYSGRVFDNYNVRTAGVKIDNPTIRDRKLLRSMEAQWAQEGIVKVKTSRGILYRVAVA